ncbi:hypothetical protein P691DRAFT_49951 [Macrolepiota fuliginosa MF-IS2]|uniref:Uncharacterized protein n=1 Tax=Macrolepiota fuliginosa MF-IS2 TaxID=1400762 RepID=A0A9P6C1F3_9AGAR|nr:hypothetical protein P691DRAFT_49951 [Macrolepiota fuliginosa MF-IS2]
MNVTMMSDPHPSEPSTFVENLACNETKIWSLEDHLAMTTCDYRWFDYAESTDILVTVNFSRIPTSVDTSLKTSVYIGMADSVDDVQASTPPMYLFPGARLHGIYQISIQERITNRRAAALGVAKYRSFVVTSVYSLFPDTISPILADNNTATLRVSIVLPAEVPVEEEYYEKSVFNGFALLGGIWTIVNGLFAGMFGSTLLLVLFGVKPLSIYGFVHSVQPRKISLVGGQDVQPISEEERDRIVRIIREHLLDIDDGVETTDGQPRSDLEAASGDHPHNSVALMVGSTGRDGAEKANAEQENLLSVEYAAKT